MVLDEDKRTCPLPGTTDHDVDSPNTVDTELTGWSLFFVITGLAIAIFLMSLDSSIIATAIPRITSQFHSTDDIGWYGSAYSFSMCALQPTTGKLFASFALKPTFLACLAVFEIGSLLCATAASSPMLIVGRAIAGAGAAGCFTGGFTILATAVPLAKRSVYIGIIQSTFGFATVIGPLLGGALTQHATWRWCFWINLPLGAITMLALGICLRLPTQESASKLSVAQKLRGLDAVGAFLFIPTIVMLLLALQWGGTNYAWKSATIIGLFVGSGGLACVFVSWQAYKREEAMIPPRLIAQRTILCACITEFFAMGAVYISIYYLPEWFQVVKDASPTKSGIMYIPLAIADVIAATATGAALRYLGYPNPFLLLGTALMSIATGLFSTFSPTTSHQYWIPYQVLQGLGAGMTLSMPYVATQTVLEPKDIPVGTSLLQCFQFLGAALWLAVAQSTFGNAFRHDLDQLGIDAATQERILVAGAADIRSVVPGAYLSGVVAAYNNALTRTFYIAASVAAVACATSMGMQWTSVKPQATKADSQEFEKN